jgi:hypothetical protein
VHQQIRTSPDTTVENIRTVLDVLAEAGVNVEGIGPDFEPPHVRVAVPHGDWERAWDALKHANLQPEARPSITFAMPNLPGQVAPLVERLVRQGYTLESLLVLASRAGERTLVSIGVRETVPPAWADTVAALGGWEEPPDWTGEERSRA